MRKLLASLLVFLTLSAAQAQIVGTLPFTFTNGSNADATQVMANYNFIINQVNANAANNGANSTITSILGLTTPLSPGQGGSQYYTAGTSTGTANAQVVATGITPAGFTLTSGKMVCFTSGFTNTGAVTLAVNGTTATNVMRKVSNGLANLVGGELTTTQFACAQYDGTQYQLPSTNAQPGNGGSPVSMTANTTVAPSQCGAFLEPNGAGAFTVTLPTPVGAAYQSCRFDLWSFATGSVTLSTPAGTFQGLGSSGAATQTIQPQFRGMLIADGANWLVSQFVRTDAPPSSIGIALPGATGFFSTNNAGALNTKIDLSTSRVIVANASGYGLQFISPATCTINFAVVGAGGIDTGALAINTWYYTYYISDGTTLSCLGSASSTAPTLPAGYTYSLRVGATETDGAANLTRVSQTGNRATYTTQLAITASGTPQAASPFFPPTNQEFFVQMSNNNVANSIGNVSDHLGLVRAGQTIGSGGGTMVMEAVVPNLGANFTANNAAGGNVFKASGWRDRVNVN